MRRCFSLYLISTPHSDIPLLHNGRKSDKDETGEELTRAEGEVTLGIRVSTVQHCEMDRAFPFGLPAWSKLFPLTSRLRVVPRRDPAFLAGGFGRENKERGKKAFRDPQELRASEGGRWRAYSSIQFRSKSRDVDTETVGRSAVR